MMMNLNSTCWAAATVLGALSLVACNSTSSSATGKNGDAGDGTGGSGATGGAGSGGGAGGASSGSGGQSGKGGVGSGAGGTGVGTVDGGADGSTSVLDGGGTAGPPGRGAIAINEVSAFAGYSSSASFASFKGRVGQAQGASTAHCTTAGACSSCVIPANLGDAAAVPTAESGLDAGVINITGVGASKATLSYGPIAQTGYSAYKGVSGQTNFFTGGDSVSVTGAGGPDLPAFAAVTLIAPGEIVLTAPACTPGGCADVDRTKDLAVAWTGGSVGQVSATFESLSADSVTILTCNFDAKSGKGTIPIAALALLEKAGDPGISGIEGFSVSNTKDFTVGDIPTTFELAISIVQGMLNVSK